MENIKEINECIEFMKTHLTETDRIEAKTAAGGFPEKCYDTISSFANTYGGVIVFGVNENNKFEEQDVYDVNDLQKQITSLCTTSMEPIIRPRFVHLKRNNVNLLAAVIEELPQRQKPCYYKPLGIQKGSYIRIGDADEHMTDYEIYNLKSYNDNIEEDLRPIKRARMEDLDQTKIKAYLDSIKIRKPNLAKFSDEKILKLSGIIENSTETIYPTLSGLLTFGEYPQSYLKQLFIACVVVPGVKLGDVGEMGQRFDDNKRVEGTLEEMLERALSFIRRNIGVKVIIDEEGKREDLPEYPMKALKEAIVNAMIHRLSEAFDNLCYAKLNVMRSSFEKALIINGFIQINFS